MKQTIVVLHGEKYQQGRKKQKIGECQGISSRMKITSMRNDGEYYTIVFIFRFIAIEVPVKIRKNNDDSLLVTYS